MKINIHKAKHFWKNKESATWTKSKDFDNGIFNRLKSKYETIKYTKPDYINIENKTIVLFYRDTQDIFGRDITELVALLINEEIISQYLLYESIESQINDPFDDSMEVYINIRDDLIKTDLKIKKSNNLVVLAIFIMLLMGVFSYIKFSNDSNYTVGDRESTVAESNSNKNKQENDEENTSPKQENLGHQQEQKEAAKEWKWSKFCKKYQGKFLYDELNEFTKLKCGKKEAFRQSLEKYTDGIDLSILKNDLNKLSLDDKKFFGVENEN